MNNPVFATKCKTAALSLYKLGREKEGYQQGNSYGTPYRYKEETWADDVGDYSTNEPNMNGTAGAILKMTHFSRK